MMGIEYGRVVPSRPDYALPKDPLEWYPTCHHKNPDLMNIGQFFIEFQKKQYLKLMYVWGHSYEFDNDDNWNVIEDFCALMSGKEDIWYATNIEIYDYVEAYRSLVFSVNGSRVYNPTAITLYLEKAGVTYCVKPGESIEL